MEEEPYDSLVLSGGGSKGFAQLGALYRYYEAKTLTSEHVKVYAGTSIGSMIALLLVCGYTPMEIFKEIYAIKSLFNVNQNLGIWELFSNFGLASIDTFAHHVEKMVMRKNDGAIPTLEELYKKTGKLLIIIATNVTNMSAAKSVFTWKTSPRLQCTDAMKMSCNLPILFTSIKYKGCYHVDGGLVCNVPLSEIPKECKKTLCIVTMGTNLAKDEMNFMSYFCRLVIIPINQITKLDCRVKPNNNTTLVMMTFNNLPILDFTMKDSDKMNMFMDGYTKADLEIQKKRLYMKDWPTIDESKDGWDHEKEDEDRDWNNDAQYESAS